MGGWGDRLVVLVCQHGEGGRAEGWQVLEGACWKLCPSAAESPLPSTKRC